jgi:sodium transport system ATP-binding protein
MIKVTNLKKEFSIKSESGKKKLLVLKDVSFVVQKGETIGLLGKNGAGKTTLIKILSTLINQTSGSVYIDGNEIFSNPPLTKSKIGVMYGGEASLYPRLTAYENIEYFGELNGVSKELVKQQIKLLSNFFEFDEYLNRRVVNFSRGMKQKVLFIRSIVHNPNIIILDEPSTGLDINGILEVENFVKYLKEQGKTIIISSHNLSEIENLTDRIIILDKGEIIYNEKNNDSVSLKDIYTKLVFNKESI